MRTLLPMALGAGFIAIGAWPALAQDGSDTPSDPLVVTEDCEVAPLAEGEVPPPSETPDTLSDALDPCNGVLEPPPSGDHEMTITPPPVGETPIIEPEDLPPQQPADPE